MPEKPQKDKEESEWIRLQQEREVREKGSPAGGGRVVPRKMTLDEIERRWR